MMTPISNSLCPQTNLEGTYFTKEQIEEISARISKDVYDKILKKLEDAMSSKSQITDEKIL